METEKIVRNPDVLECLANLSNDEVFTPPRLANAMLDLLPQGLFSDPSATFLDPCCKSGVFLREIAKRLIKGLEPTFPDLQERLDHIFHRQLFGLAITELTALIARRTVYCSKFADGRYALSHFDAPAGNILLPPAAHAWKGGRCALCGASAEVFGKRAESHAYAFIHGVNPERLFDMKFDVIIGNPPYQLATGSITGQATPIYDKFITLSKQLNPQFLCMIIPSRWFAGGMGLEDFRTKMLNDRHILKLVDFSNAKDCFPESSIGGGVCYFLWERDKVGDCSVENIHKGEKSQQIRSLSEYPVFVRYNEARCIIRKVLPNLQKDPNCGNLKSIISPLSPFGLNSFERGSENPAKPTDLRLLSSKRWGYIPRESVTQGEQYIDKWKVAISKVTAEHANEPDKQGFFKVITRMVLLKPREVCTFSYFLIGCEETETRAKNIIKYLSTRFARFLLLQAVSSINLSKDKFLFVPLQDFSRPWTDEELYAKYGLTDEEIAFIESMVKPMEV